MKEIFLEVDMASSHLAASHDVAVALGDDYDPADVGPGKKRVVCFGEMNGNPSFIVALPSREEAELFLDRLYGKGNHEGVDVHRVRPRRS